MTLPINIEDLLGGLVVEGNRWSSERQRACSIGRVATEEGEANRVEYKKGWNPDPIYRTICAFANDFDDTCGGYIVVGVDEVDGWAVRPVTGIDINDIEPIENRCHRNRSQTSIEQPKNLQIVFLLLCTSPPFVRIAGDSFDICLFVILDLDIDSEPNICEGSKKRAQDLEIRKIWCIFAGAKQ